MQWIPFTQTFCVQWCWFFEATVKAVNQVLISTTTRATPLTMVAKQKVKLGSVAVMDALTFGRGWQWRQTVVPCSTICKRRPRRQTSEHLSFLCRGSCPWCSCCSSSLCIYVCAWLSEINTGLVYCWAAEKWNNLNDLTKQKENNVNVSAADTQAGSFSRNTFSVACGDVQLSALPAVSQSGWVLLPLHFRNKAARSSQHF